MTTICLLRIHIPSNRFFILARDQEPQPPMTEKYFKFSRYNSLICSTSSEEHAALSYNILQVLFKPFRASFGQPFHNFLISLNVLRLGPTDVPINNSRFMLANIYGSLMNINGKFPIEYISSEAQSQGPKGLVQVISAPITHFPTTKITSEMRSIDYTYITASLEDPVLLTPSMQRTV